MSRSIGAAIGAFGLLLAGGLLPARADETPAPRRHVMRMGVGHARLGVNLADVGADDVARLKLKDDRGARVSGVEPGSAAAAAGLQKDDVIVRYDGDAVRSASQLARLVRETPRGRTVELEVSRDGALQQLSATLGGKDDTADLGELDTPELHGLPNVPDLREMPELQGLMDSLRTMPGMVGPDRDAVRDQARDEVMRAFRSRGPRLGIRYHELSDQLAGYFKVEDGVLVSSVDEDSPAAKAGLKAGDVIVKLNGSHVGDAASLGREVARLEDGVPATITVQRDGKPVDLKVTIEGGRPRRVPRGPTT